MERKPLKNTSATRAARLSERKRMVERLADERVICEATIPEICSGVPSDIHEIKTRGRGGNYWNDQENVLALCRPCHSFITTNPKWSLANGFVVHAEAGDEELERARRLRDAFVYGSEV